MILPMSTTGSNSSSGFYGQTSLSTRHTLMSCTLLMCCLFMPCITVHSMLHQPSCTTQETQRNGCSHTQLHLKLETLLLMIKVCPCFTTCQKYICSMISRAQLSRMFPYNSLTPQPPSESHLPPAPLFAKLHSCPAIPPLPYC